MTVENQDVFERRRLFLIQKTGGHEHDKHSVKCKMESRSNIQYKVPAA